MEYVTGNKEYFPGIGRIRFEGRDSDNPLAFKFYDENKVVAGRTMKEHLRFAIAYWHTFCGTGEDPFGPGTQLFPWATGDNAIERARNKMDAAFEFFTKIGAPYYCFHDIDVVSFGESIAEYESNLQAMVEYAKQNPGKVRSSTSGKYSASFFVMKMIESEAGIKFTQVPYKGGQAVITALLGGHVESSFDATMKFTPHMKAGKLRILLTTKEMRDFPDIPTPQDLGYKLELPSVFFAFYGPVGMPAEVKETLVKAIKKAVAIPESKEKIEKLGFVVEYRTPEELKKMVAQEYKDAYEIMKEVGVHK